MKKWEKMKKMMNNEKMKKFGFTRKILDDIHEFVSECVFPEEKQQPVLGGHRFSQEKWQQPLKQHLLFQNSWPFNNTYDTWQPNWASTSSTMIDVARRWGPGTCTNDGLVCVGNEWIVSIRGQDAARCIEHSVCRWLIGFCRSEDARHGTMLRTLCLKADLLSGCDVESAQGVPLLKRCVCDLSVKGFGANANWHVYLFSSWSPALIRASLVSIWSETCMLTRSHIVRGPVGLFYPRMLTAGAGAALRLDLRPNEQQSNSNSNNTTQHNTEHAAQKQREEKKRVFLNTDFSKPVQHFLPFTGF